MIIDRGVFDAAYTFLSGLLKILWLLWILKDITFGGVRWALALSTAPRSLFFPVISYNGAGGIFPRKIIFLF